MNGNEIFTLRRALRELPASALIEAGSDFGEFCEALKDGNDPDHENRLTLKEKKVLCDLMLPLYGELGPKGAGSVLVKFLSEEAGVLREHWAAHEAVDAAPSLQTALSEPSETREPYDIAQELFRLSGEYIEAVREAGESCEKYWWIRNDRTGEILTFADSAGSLRDVLARHESGEDRTAWRTLRAEEN